MVGDLVCGLAKDYRHPRNTVCQQIIKHPSDAKRRRTSVQRKRHGERERKWKGRKRKEKRNDFCARTFKKRQGELVQKSGKLLPAELKTPKGAAPGPIRVSSSNVGTSQEGKGETQA